MQDRPIIIHQHLMQEFMKLGKDYSNALALYSFYLYHGHCQKTNKPLATDKFTSKGINWGIEKVKRVKKILKILKVIKVVQKRVYSYVHVIFMYTKKKIEEIFDTIESKKEPAKEKIEVKLESKIAFLQNSELMALASSSSGLKPLIPKSFAKPIIKTPFEVTLESYKIPTPRIKEIKELFSSTQELKATLLTVKHLVFG